MGLKQLSISAYLMRQQVVKDLLSIFMKNPTYFYSEDSIKITDISQLNNLSTMNIFFQMIEKFKLDRLVSKMTKLKIAGKSNYEILMFETSDEIQELAQRHGEALAIASCLGSLEKLTTSK